VFLPFELIPRDWQNVEGKSIWKWPLLAKDGDRRKPMAFAVLTGFKLNLESWLAV